MATSYGLSDHHQAITHKLKKAVICGAESSVYMGSHLLMLIFINSLNNFKAVNKYLLTPNVNYS